MNSSSSAFRRALRVTGIVLVGVALLVVALVAYVYVRRTGPDRTAREKMTAPPPTLTVDEHTFRDLNKNGVLDPYEDARRPVQERVDDLLARMTLEEKAGTMMHPFQVIGEEGALADPFAPLAMAGPTAYDAIFNRHITHVAVMGADAARHMAAWTNRMQRLAERTRLGIPLSFSSDPRHSYHDEPVLATVTTEAFSRWTDPIGFGAIDDSAFTASFGRIAAREYRAVGFHTALHPMADLATEPRWGRIQGTFGEDAERVATLTAAYVRGVQGEQLGPRSVATMTKHFSGGGPQEDGWDPHFKYGAAQVYPGDRFDYHLIPFRSAIEAGTAAMMPYYGIPVDQTSENVGFSFNRKLITGLLRDSLGYDGIVCTDWNLIEPITLLGFTVMEAKDHGVEHLSPREKTLKALRAGVDQFGGESTPDHVVALVRDGVVPEARLDTSVRRLLRLKFALGLFDDPYVDPQRADSIAGNDAFRQAGYESQLRSTVLLTNTEVDDRPILPLQPGTKLFLQGVDAAVAASYGEVVRRPDEADVALVRLDAPYDPRDGILERMIHQGRLHYTDEDLAPVREVMRAVPTIVAVYLERPAILTPLVNDAAALLAEFNVSDEALLDVVFGRHAPTGTLPFELPSSTEAVERQHEDVPYDSEEPLFSFGHGLRYGE